MKGDNQANTSSKDWLLFNTQSAVISSWDETRKISIGTLPPARPGTWDTGIEVKMNPEALVRSRSVVAREVAGETLIVPIRGKVGDLASIYTFNGTGSLIWKLLESPKTVADLVAAVSREFEIDPLVAEQDLASFVSEMKAVGLVEVSAVALAGD